MSQENVEIVRAVQQQFARGDLDLIATADDFELVTPAGIRMAVRTEEKLLAMVEGVA